MYMKFPADFTVKEQSMPFQLVVYLSKWKKKVLFKNTNLLVKMWNKNEVPKHGEMGGVLKENLDFKPKKSMLELDIKSDFGHCKKQFAV